MNSKIYLFGELGNGYTQYPTDHTQSYFQDFERNVKGQTAMCTRHEGDLILYQYIRRLSGRQTQQNGYIGIAIVYNGVMVNNLTPLFHMCEDVITNLVVSGTILKFTDDGDIAANVDKLYLAYSEFIRISEYLSAQINAESALFEALPSVNYALGKDQSKSFFIEDDMEEIIEATRNYAKVYVLKNTDYNSETLTSFSAKLHTLNQAKKTAWVTIKKQQSEIAALNKKQKNYDLVLVLGLVVILGFAGGMAYVSGTNDKIKGMEIHNRDLETSVDAKQQTILQQRDSLNELIAKTHQQQIEISTLNRTTQKLTSDKEQLDEELQRVCRQLTSANAKVEQLEKENVKQKTAITTLQSRLNGNTHNSTTSSSTYANNIVGASIYSFSTAGYDKNYSLWFYARKPLKINYFYVKSDRTGYVIIGLYNSSHTLVASHKVYLTKESVTKVTPAFTIYNSGNYYLAIEHSIGGLSYHKSNVSEFAKYKSGDLQIQGISLKGKTNINTTFYQYFYYISYSLL